MEKITFLWSDSKNRGCASTRSTPASYAYDLVNYIQHVLLLLLLQEKEGDVVVNVRGARP